MKPIIAILITGILLCGRTATSGVTGSFVQRISQTAKTGTPDKAVKGFLNWYVANKPTLEPLAAAILDRKTDDTTYAYRVNWDATQKYLAEIKKSGFVSDNYIQTVKAFFKNCDDELAKYPRYEGAYPKLDSDVILRIQEDDDIIGHLNEMVTLANAVSGNRGTVTTFIRSARLKLNFKLSRGVSGWLIDSYKPQYLPLQRN